MHSLSLIFVFALILRLVVQVLLERRRIHWVLEHRQQVPERFAASVTLEEHQLAADYTVAKSKLGMVEDGVDAVVLLVWTLGGGLALLDRLIAIAGGSGLVRGVAFLIAITLVSMLIGLPLAVYRTFRLEDRFGFNRTTAATFVLDRIKGIFLLLILGAPLAGIILFLMQSAGAAWWLYAWAVFFGFQLLVAWAYPRIIAPLFNRFRPLEDGELRGRIERLAERLGFDSKGVFVIDGSKRSTHGNAYFAGFGRSKKIVLFDTLIERLSAPQLEAVLAHELGHFKLKHVAKRLLVSALISLAGLGLLGFLVQQDWFYRGLGLAGPSLHGALALFMLALPVFTFWLTPLGALWSRRHEYEADRFAARESSADDLKDALTALFRDNHAFLAPEPVASKFYDSHPPAPLRIAALEEGS